MGLKSQLLKKKSEKREVQSWYLTIVQLQSQHWERLSGGQERTAWVIQYNGGREEERCGEKEGDRCRVVTSGCLRGLGVNQGCEGEDGSGCTCAKPRSPTS